jgi:hypothetical protein
MSSDELPAGVQVTPALALIETDYDEVWQDVPEPAFEDVSQVQPVVVRVRPPFVRVRRLDANCKRLARAAIPPPSSHKIDQLAEAEAYHLHNMVGDWIVRCREETVIVRIDPNEIHPYTCEKERQPNAPRVRRRHHKHEERYFDVGRARLMDQIFPTIVAPARALPTRQHGSVQLLSHEFRKRRILVHLDLDEKAPTAATLRMFRLRSAYAPDGNQVHELMRGKPTGWPPK